MNCVASSPSGTIYVFFRAKNAPIPSVSIVAAAMASSLLLIFGYGLSTRDADVSVKFKSVALSTSELKSSPTIFLCRSNHMKASAVEHTPAQNYTNRSPALVKVLTRPLTVNKLLSSYLRIARFSGSAKSSSQRSAVFLGNREIFVITTAHAGC